MLKFHTSVIIFLAWLKSKSSESVNFIEKLAHRKKITIVVGKPMPVEKVEEPSSEQIKNLHAKYVEELQKLYNEYNPVYGDPNVTLKIE